MKQMKILIKSRADKIKRERKKKRKSPPHQQHCTFLLRGQPAKQ